MKKIAVFSSLALVTGLLISSCGGKNDPGKIYMPDMTYSRAYETYAERDSFKFTTDGNNKGGSLIYYNDMAVAGTIKRGELFPYTLPNDSNGYKMSGTVKNPLDSVSAADLAEAGRLYNINCGICHGEKGAGNGPIAAAGHIGGVANLTLDAYKQMGDGTMFHSMTYGRNLMGSYASQLDSRQRWMIVKYIRSLQGIKAAAPGTPAPAAAGKDSTGTAVKTDSTAKKA